MQNLKLTKYVLIFFFLLYLPTKIWSQESEVNTSFNRASQYYLGAKDEILMNVNIWGYVQKPGQYLIPRNTGLIALISFAGGPREGANISKVRIIREVRTRQGENGHDRQKEKASLITVDVKRYIETGETEIIPLLKAGDTVLIAASSGHKFQKFLGIGSVFGIIAAGYSIALIIDILTR